MKPAEGCKGMLIEIPDVGLTEQELRRELAVALFQQRRATLAKAADIAGVTRLDFQRILAARQLPVHYGLDEWARDLQGLREQYDR
jgi:predicted HTH domain antitoxin